MALLSYKKLGTLVGAIRNSWGLHPTTPQQFGWQFANISLQFGSIFGNSAVLRLRWGKLCHSLPGNSGGNSPTIPDNSEACSAVRLFCACTGENSVIRSPASRVAIRQQFLTSRKHFSAIRLSCACTGENSVIRSPAIRVATRAIRVAIHQQFRAIRKHARQFGCSVHAQSVGHSAIRSPGSFPLTMF